MKRYGRAAAAEAAAFGSERNFPSGIMIDKEINRFHSMPLKVVLPVILLLLCGIGALLLLWWQPKRQTRDIEPLKDRLGLENELRRTLAQMLGGLAVLASLFFTWRTLDATWRNLGLAQSAQLSERFTRAIDQLGSEKLALRLGSMHALERISKDSQEDHGAVVEIVSAFIRESALWPPRESDRPGCRSPVVDEAKPKPCADIQAALSFLARRKWRDTESGLLDLSSSDLQGAILKNAHLEGADLRETHLEGADLTGAFLEEALSGEPIWKEPTLWILT